MARMKTDVLKFLFHFSTLSSYIVSWSLQNIVTTLNIFLNNSLIYQDALPSSILSFFLWGKKLPLSFCSSMC